MVRPDDEETGNVTQDDTLEHSRDGSERDSLSDSSEIPSDIALRAQSKANIRMARKSGLLPGYPRRVVPSSTVNQGDIEGIDLILGDGNNEALLVAHPHIQEHVMDVVESTHSEPTPTSTDRAINPFLASAPAAIRKVASNEWPTLVPISKKLDAKEAAKLRNINEMLTKAKNLGEEMYNVAVKNHKDFSSILKQGAIALAEDRKTVKQLEKDLKKEQSNRAAEQSALSEIKFNAKLNEEKIRTLEETKNENSTKIKKYETKIDELEKSFRKAHEKGAKPSADDMVEVHRKKKTIDLQANILKQQSNVTLKDKTQRKRKRDKRSRMDEAATLSILGGGGSTFTGRLGGSFENDSESDYSVSK
jgi:hypothetical protein